MLLKWYIFLFFKEILIFFIENHRKNKSIRKYPKIPCSDKISKCIWCGCVTHFECGWRCLYGLYSLGAFITVIFVYYFVIFSLYFESEIQLFSGSPSPKKRTFMVLNLRILDLRYIKKHPLEFGANTHILRIK